jgi:hypothetical protein
MRFPVHPAVPDPNTTPVITGPVIRVPARHAKIRRDSERTARSSWFGPGGAGERSQRFP